MLQARPAVLGISAFGHDTSACLVHSETWQVVFAIAEERLSNRKHDAHFPIGAVAECINAAQRQGYVIEEVGLNQRPIEFLGFLIAEIRRLADSPTSAETLIGFINQLPPSGYFSKQGANSLSELIASAIDAATGHPEKQRTLHRRFRWYFNWYVKHTRIVDACRSCFPDTPVTLFNHHYCHAETTYETSGYDDSAILIVDGQGEYDTVTIYYGSADKITSVQKSGWPFSLGIFYLFATTHLGFGLGDEYKVMGMAAYGTPRFLPYLAPSFQVAADGRLTFTPSEFLAPIDLPQTGHAVFAFSPAFHGLVPPRAPDGELKQIHFDFAASVQALTQNIGIALAEAARRLTGARNLALAGGVALNGLMNEQIRQRAGFDQVFIYPASGDDGTSVGAAYAALRKRKPAPRTRSQLSTCFYGNGFGESEIETVLLDRSAKYSRPQDLHATIADAVARGRIVARYVGRSEFGPRALGNRSILADPRHAGMRDVLNMRIKQRESFRPFAPACLTEHVSKYFEVPVATPFMLLIGRAKSLAHAEIPAVVHKDGTARLQTVDQQSNPDFYATISAFHRRTEVPVLINTSFNVNGEAIVETPLDAIESFCFMDIDHLAIGPFWLDRNANRHILPALGLSEFLERRKQRYASRSLGPLTQMDIAEFDPSFFIREE